MLIIKTDIIYNIYIFYVSKFSILFQYRYSLYDSIALWIPYILFNI